MIREFIIDKIGKCLRYGKFQAVITVSCFTYLCGYSILQYIDISWFHWWTNICEPVSTSIANYLIGIDAVMRQIPYYGHPERVSFARHMMVATFLLEFAGILFLFEFGLIKKHAVECVKQNNLLTLTAISLASVLLIIVMGFHYYWIGSDLSDYDSVKGSFMPQYRNSDLVIWGMAHIFMAHFTFLSVSTLICALYYGIFRKQEILELDK